MDDNQYLLADIKKIPPKHCDNCGSKYMPGDFKILKLTKTNAVIHLHCNSCMNTYVINAFSNNNGISSQRSNLVLDLKNVKEIQKFSSVVPISKNDAIDMYNYLEDGGTLEKNTGDFKEERSFKK